ncbi:MAG: Fic family protein [Burkholderiales bacterium]|nr:Fic family protein [Burkholderiales bacterium]
MQWNWQQADWPEFSWKQARLLNAEALFLLEAGEYAGTAKHLAAEDRELLTVEAMSTEAVTTSAIEGEILDRASVLSSIRRQLGLATDQRKVGAAEQGVSEMMVDLHHTFAEPFSHDMLFRWHRMLTTGRRDLKNVGSYRTHIEPMQVVSGAIHDPKVHFEAPPSASVLAEMSRFIDWFNRSAPGNAEPLPALTRAGIAHLYFICIHPFEDGNGRIGRVIAEKVLAQSLGHPTLTALAATILAKRNAYYGVLEANNKQLETTPWLAWFAATAIEAQRRSIALVDFLIDKTRLLDRLRDQLNERQKKALLRMLREGPQGFEGGLSAGKYAGITGASPATATRDLADLVAKHALVRSGEQRHTRYEIAIPLRPVSPVAIDEHGNLK